MSSSLGQLFKITTFGESHGNSVGVVIDGCPPLLEISLEDIQRDLDLRRPGQSDLTTPRDESDKAEILSGVFEGKTLGTPIAIAVKNKDAKSQDYDELKEVFRPGHADYTTLAKYGTRDHRGGGRASARETIGRVAAGAVARKLINAMSGIEVLAWVSQVHNVQSKTNDSKIKRKEIYNSPTRCPDKAAAADIEGLIRSAKEKGDSLGGVISCLARNMPAGLGEPVFDKLDAELAKALMSVPATKGVEIGSGFSSTEMTGIEHNDPFESDKKGNVRTTSNHSGGIQGGISNGEDLFLRLAFKPTSTISQKQSTVDSSGKQVTLEAAGRHDPCVLPRAAIIVESMVCLVLADHLLRQKVFLER